MVFCNEAINPDPTFWNYVTILILIDGFLQYYKISHYEPYDGCHNPYFNRWFSAICIWNYIQFHLLSVTILILIDGFLQSIASKAGTWHAMSQSLF